VTWVHPEWWSGIEAMLNPRAEQINVPDGATHVIAHKAGNDD
jgi:hypothetical protein